MNLLQFILILAAVESGMDPNAVGDNGKAVGLLQIHPVMVQDINRIIGEDKFTLQDRRDPKKSIQMAVIYFRHYERDSTWEEKARAWNGGPNWRDKRWKTDAYWRKVCRLR